MLIAVIFVVGKEFRAANEAVSGWFNSLEYNARALENSG